MQSQSQSANPFPAPPSTSTGAQGGATMSHRGPYPYPYQGSYADVTGMNARSSGGNNNNNTGAAAASNAGAVDPAKAARLRSHAEKLQQLAAKKDARDQAAANVAQMRAQMLSGGLAAADAPSASTRGGVMDEDVEAKSAAAKRANKKKTINSTDYLDFDEKFGGRTFNILSVALLASALVLFYVLWFTDLVY